MSLLHKYVNDDVHTCINSNLTNSQSNLTNQRMDIAEPQEREEIICLNVLQRSLLDVEAILQFHQWYKRVPPTTVYIVSINFPVVTAKEW